MLCGKLIMTPVLYKRVLTYNYIVRLAILVVCGRKLYIYSLLANSKLFHRWSICGFHLGTNTLATPHCVGMCLHLLLTLSEWNTRMIVSQQLVYNTLNQGFVIIGTDSLSFQNLAPFASEIFCGPLLSVMTTPHPAYKIVCCMQYRDGKHINDCTVRFVRAGLPWSEAVYVFKFASDGYLMLWGIVAY